MTKFTFGGYSDDIFMAAKDGRVIEECYPPQQYLLKDGDDRMVITAHYGERAAVWSIGIEPFDEDVLIPNWPVTFTLGEYGYSSSLTIEAPDSSELLIANQGEATPNE